MSRASPYGAPYGDTSMGFDMEKQQQQQQHHRGRRDSETTSGGIQPLTSDSKQRHRPDTASSVWCTSEENPRQRYVHEMVFREQRQREKFQIPDDSLVDKTAGTSRSPFPMSTGSPMATNNRSPMTTNSGEFPSISDESRQRMRLNVVDREHSSTSGTPRPPSCSSDLASFPACSGVQSVRGVVDCHGYSRAMRDHQAAMQYPVICGDAASAAATSMYSQLALRQHLEILRHRHHQMLIESAGQFPGMAVPDSTKMFNWSVPSLLADPHQVGVEADRFLLNAGRDGGLQRRFFISFILFL